MSAKRFNSPGVMIVLLAMCLLIAGCASLRPPVLETGDAVESDVIAAVETKELEGNEPPEAMQTVLVAIAEVLQIVAPVIIGH